MADNYEKIFVIGFNKCATSTIDCLFRKNDISSYHQGGKYKTQNWKDLLDKYKCFSDIDFDIKTIKELDEKYPNSLFILNTRGIRKWIISRFEHGVRGCLKQGKHKYYPFSEELMISWIETRNKYYKDVLEYFKNNSHKLIILNIEGNKWENYFLGKLNLKLNINSSANVQKKSREYSSICNSVDKTFNNLKYTDEIQNELLLDNHLNDYYLKIYDNNF